jgi:inosine-uridine nucleoside N-ribohydrolase
MTTTTSWIIDTDAGMDDFLAIQCLLPLQPCITTVGGVLSASHAADTLRQLFPCLGIAVGLNSWKPNSIPNWLQQYRSITVAALLPASKSPPSGPPQDAWTVVQNQLMENADNSVNILCLGPLTNVAHWLTQCDLSIKIRSIWIMGGNHPHHQQQPEFNFSWDPTAAQTVLGIKHLNDKIHLVTGCVSSREQLIQTVGNGAFVEFLQRTQRDSVFFRRLLEHDDAGYFVSYDSVCTFASQHPEHVQWEQIPLQVQADGLLKSRQGSIVRVARRISFEPYYFDWIYAQTTKNQVSDFMIA